MNLPEMLKEVHRYDENMIIAEFKNGVGVVYQKISDGVVYSAIRSEVIDGLDLDSVQRLDGQKDDYLSGNFYHSSEVENAVKDFSKKSYQIGLENKIQDQFGEVVGELELIPHTKRDWGYIGTSLTAGLLAPTMLLTVPLLCAYAAATKGRSGNEGDMGIIALAFAPVIMPAIGIKELTNPSPKYFRMKKTDAVVTENKGNLPAVNYIQGDLNQFYSMGVCFPSGDKGTITLDDHYVMDNYYRDNAAEDYVKATKFLNTSPAVNDEMNRLLEERAAFPNVLKDFTAQLNKENQEALLKSIGFL